MEIFIPSDSIEYLDSLEALLELKLSEHVETPTEASNLVDDLYKTSEVKYKTNNNSQMLSIKFTLFEGLKNLPCF